MWIFTMDVFVSDVTPLRPKGRSFGGAVHATPPSTVCVDGFTEPPSTFRLRLGLRLPVLLWTFVPAGPAVFDTISTAASLMHLGCVSIGMIPVSACDAMELPTAAMSVRWIDSLAL